MNTWLNQGRLRRPGRGLKKWEKLVESKSTNRLEHKNPDTPPGPRIFFHCWLHL